MNPDNELFDQAVKSKDLAGRLADDSPIRSRPIFAFNKNTADRIINSFRTTSITIKDLPKVLVDYIDSSVPRACAFKHGDVYVIAISCGLMLILEFMLYRLFSSREFCPNLGDISLENDSLPMITVGPDFDLIDSELKTRGLTIDDYYPKDQDRRNAADYFLHQAIVFLMGHEFRHIQAGHCDYYNNKLQLQIVSEIVSNSSSPLTSMKQQAMEWDADAFSIQATINHSIKSLKHAKRSLEIGARVLAEIYYDSDRFLALVTIACYAFFKLFDLDEEPSSMWAYRSHPPTSLRRSWIVRDTLETARIIDNSIFSSQSESNVNEQLINHYDPILDSIWDLPGHSANPPLDLEVAADHEMRTYNSLKSICNDLRRYSFVPILD